MKRRRFGIQLLLLFAAVLVGYAAVYGWIEHRRVVRGPWVVTFASDSGGAALTVNQTALGIHEVRIVFPGHPAETNAPQTLTFDKARSWPYPVPLGQCVFMDTTFLPGTIVLQLLGHEIQLLPRVLTIDKVERPWRSGERIELRAK